MKHNCFLIGMRIIEIKSHIDLWVFFIIDNKYFIEIVNNILMYTYFIMDYNQ
jgi:hypothetical protein